MKIKLAMLALLTLLSPLTQAQRYNDRGDRHRDEEPRRDRAQVIQSRAVTERVYNNEEVCWERGRNHRDRGTGGAIAGALIGGLLGNQVGRGDGRRAATVAGAVAGAIAGRNIDRNDRDRYDCEQRQVYQDQTQYRVQYRYGHRVYQSTVPYQPGRRIPVWVSYRNGRTIVEPII